MKILLVASNPKAQKIKDEATANSLELEREITELQRRLVFQDSLNTLDLRVLPQLSVHELTDKLHSYRPDVLHISAHGNKKGLLFANERGNEREIDNATFVKLLSSIEHRPKVVFVSACFSADLAKELATIVDFAVGATDEIWVDAAREASVRFYELLARGYSVQRAFDGAAVVVKIEQCDVVHLTLEKRLGKDPEKSFLAEPLRLLACFSDVEELKEQPNLANSLKLEPDSDGDFEIEFGIVGCPADTRQVVFFVDVFDEDKDKAGSVAVQEFIWIDTAEPKQGERWVDEVNDHLLVPGDCGLHAALVTRSGRAQIISSTICEALRQYYFGEPSCHRLPESVAGKVRNAIRRLEQNNGARRSEDAASLFRGARQLKRRSKARAKG